MKNKSRINQNDEGKLNNRVDTEKSAGSRVLLAQHPRPSRFSGHDRRWAEKMIKYIKNKKNATLQLLLIFFVHCAFGLTMPQKDSPISDLSSDVEFAPLAFEVTDFIFNIEYKNKLATFTMKFDLIATKNDNDVIDKIKRKLNEIKAELEKRVPPIVEHYLESTYCHGGLLQKDIRKIVNDIINRGEKKTEEVIKKVIIYEFILK